MPQVLASAVRTADTTANITGYNPLKNNGLMLIVDWTVDGGGNITPKVNIFDDAASAWVLFTGFASINTVGTYIYVIRESEAVAASPITEVLARQIPNATNLQLLMDHSGSQSHTYSVSALWYP